MTLRVSGSARARLKIHTLDGNTSNHPRHIEPADPHSTAVSFSYFMLFLGLSRTFLCEIQWHKDTVVRHGSSEVPPRSANGGNEWKCDVVCYVMDRCKRESGRAGRLSDPCVCVCHGQLPCGNNIIYAISWSVSPLWWDMLLFNGKIFELKGGVAENCAE